MGVPWKAKAPFVVLELPYQRLPSQRERFAIAISCTDVTTGSIGCTGGSIATWRNRSTTTLEQLLLSLSPGSNRCKPPCGQLHNEYSPLY